MQPWLTAAVLLFLACSVNGQDAVLNDTCAGQSGINEVANMIQEIDIKLSQQSLQLDKVIQLVLLQGGSGSIGGSGQSRVASCKELFNKGFPAMLENKAYLLNVESEIIPVYCHMEGTTKLEACGGGGWTLVMKINGEKRTFHYDSQLWTDKREHHPSSGKNLFDHQETKLPTYWSTPFSKICLAMKIGNQVKSIVIYKYANSLYSLIADGKYRPTLLGRQTWKRLIGEQASLQTNCNQEGFNSVTSTSKARIGIIGNNENDCKTCDSRIGFGTGGQIDDGNTCGNVAKYGGDNGDKHIKAMGYILVK